MSNRRSLELLCAVSLALVASCGLETADTIEPDVAVEVAPASESLVLSRNCNDKLKDIYTKPNNLPGYNQSRRGDVVRCAKDRILSVDEVAKSLKARDFAEISAKYPVQMLRLTYRTERFTGTATVKPDLSSAILLLPLANYRPGESAATAAEAEAAADADIQVEVELAGGSKVMKRPPLVLFAHGTVPYGQSCAYSRNDPTKDPPRLPKDTELGSLIALATRGFPVIMSDYAGFVESSPLTGYLSAQDEAHSLLDATFAVPKLLNRQFENVVILGHSQGGHAALSAQALARSFGMAGKLVGVAAFAPFWVHASIFGLIVSDFSGFTTAANPGELSFAIEYLYLREELLGGTGKGVNLFQPKVRDDLKKFTSSCRFFEPIPTKFGNTTRDFFQPDFVTDVGNCSVLGVCESALALEWAKRFNADRPAIDPSGAPILMWHGASDDVIPPPFAKCAIDKIRADLSPSGQSAKFTFCGDPIADHETLLARDLTTTVRWINARAFGAPEPGQCAGEEVLLPQPLVCPEPPSNTARMGAGVPGLAGLTGQRSPSQ